MHHGKRAVLELSSNSRPLDRQKFGGLFSALWVTYLLEPLPHAQGMSLVNLLGYPVVDAIGLLVLGLLLSWLCPVTAATPRMFGAVNSRAGIVALVFVAVRICWSATLPFYTWFAERPILTLVWVAGTGAFLGVFFQLVRPLLPRRPAAAALAFAGWVVGVDLVLFNGFMLLVAVVDPLDTVLRAVFDAASLGLGAWLVARRPRGGL